MEIGIVTVFYTENCGSILQATALANKLEEYGHNVYFIDTKNKFSGHSIKRLIKNSCKCILRSVSPVNSIKLYKSFSIYIKNNFKIVSPEKNFDLVIIGSDTVWDMTSDYFLLSQDVFWGRSISCSQISTYAVSIANSPYSLLDSIEYIEECIKNFKFISVRDKYTKNYIESKISNDIDLVCDPTLLFNKEFYLKHTYNINTEDYVLLYLFDEPSPDVSDKIKQFAKTNHCIIISLIFMEKKITCADKYIESTVDNFLTYFSNAKYIITNTFHGTIFSVIFNKNFVVLDYKKQKITEFLNDIRLIDRISSLDFETILLQDIDFKIVNKDIDELRSRSIIYIEKMLK